MRWKYVSLWPLRAAYLAVYLFSSALKRAGTLYLTTATSFHGSSRGQLLTNTFLCKSWCMGSLHWVRRQQSFLKVEIYCPLISTIPAGPMIFFFNGYHVQNQSCEIKYKSFLLRAKFCVHSLFLCLLELFQLTMHLINGKKSPKDSSLGGIFQFRRGH